jgi:hypothetical protein
MNNIHFFNSSKRFSLENNQSIEIDEKEQRLEIELFY